MKCIKFLTIIGIAFLLLGCGRSTPKYEKTPVDVLIQQLSDTRDFSIILNDMNYDESKNQYLHKYQILVPREDTVLSTTTEAMPVSDMFFEKHMNDMGMEIVSKVDGKITRKPAPPGYNHYVGNEKYGQWRQRDGGSFWEFYGKYAFMSSMFNMMSYPVHRSYYNDYRSNYYGSRGYYGPSNNGRNYYGTRSSWNQSRSSTAWNSKPGSFKDRVRSRVKQSASTSRRNLSAKRSRSTSRYGSSSYRSRGGGFGK
jgi:hypothetical protein